MEYFFYCRDRQGAEALHEELSEAHWAFMDRYAATMIARGPTMTAAGTVTGSVHIVDLPGSAAAREFAFDEPNYRAGVYDEVLVRRWRSLLGRTMWDFAGAVAGYGRFLILGHGRRAAIIDAGLRGEQRDYLTAGGYRDRLIACGPLLDHEGTSWLGTAILAELPDLAAAEALLHGSPYAQAGRYAAIEAHHWQFGGRPPA
jgi:uncharacterized protein YciI